MLELEWIFTNLGTILLLGIGGIVAYALFFLYVEGRPRKPTAHYEEAPIEIKNLSSASDIDHLFDEAIGRFRIPILEDYIALLREVVGRFPPPLQDRKT